MSYWSLVTPCGPSFVGDCCQWPLARSTWVYGWHHCATGLDGLEGLSDPRSAEALCGVTAGNMDSMVNKFSSRHVRNKDAYSPDGQIGLRPDRATIAYTAKVKQAFKGVPVVIGGIEASLRRLVHYDYWQDKIRGSILLDSKADLLVHGMGEHQVVEIANRLNAGQQIKDCWDINGVLYALGAKDPLPKDAILLPSLEDCRKNGRAFAAMTVESYRQANPHCGKPMMQAHGSRWIVQMPPAVPLTTEELDKVHELPYTNQAHPAYRAKIPALQSIQGSIAVNRGCSGGCSFCALTTHQGKDVVSRSEKSVLARSKNDQAKGLQWHH